MKLKKICIVLIILIMMFTYFPMISKAEEVKQIEVTTIETPDFVKTNALKGKSLIDWMSNDEITMIATKSAEDAKIIYNGYNTIYSGIYSQLYYTNDIGSFNKVDLKQYFTNKGINLNDSLVEIKNIYKENNSFYIEIIIDYVFNTTYKYYEKSKYMILEINNQMNIGEVILPNNSTVMEIENVDIISCVYETTFMLLMGGFGHEFENVYYTTNDFKKWEEKKLPEATKEYELVEIELFDDGVNLLFTKEVWVEEWNNSYRALYSCSTSDFENYKLFIEDGFDYSYDIPYFYTNYAIQQNNYISVICDEVKIYYKDSCFNKYKKFHTFKLSDEKFKTDGDGYGNEGVLNYISMNSGKESERVYVVYGYACDDKENDKMFVCITNVNENTVLSYYLGLFRDYPLEWVLRYEDNLYFLNGSNELLILNNNNYSEMRKINLSDNYNSLCYIGDKIIALGDEESLIFDASDFKEKTTISGLNINDVKVENIKKQLLNILNVLEDQILKIVNQEGKEIETGKNVGTGTKVTVKNGDSEKEYTIVIYGDITGDGEINAVDALALIKGINNKISFKSELHKEAGRILVGDGEEPTALDALAIVKAANNKYTINQSK